MRPDPEQQRDVAGRAEAERRHDVRLDRASASMLANRVDVVAHGRAERERDGNAEDGARDEQSPHAAILAVMTHSLPVAERPRRPEWMKVRAPSADSRYFDVKKLIHGASLNTICEEARCPNIAECWGRGTATFQILGDTCTRACRYCYVHSGKPESPPDPLEPLRLAQVAAQMQLKHVVVTSVDRDDVPDRGAGHYAATIRALKRKVAERERRGADARLPRRRGGGAAHGARRAARRLQPQHRDRAPPAPEDARREGELRHARCGCCAARRSSPTIPC